MFSKNSQEPHKQQKQAQESSSNQRGNNNNHSVQTTTSTARFKPYTFASLYSTSAGSSGSVNRKPLLADQQLQTLRRDMDSMKIDHRDRGYGQLIQNVNIEQGKRVEEVIDARVQSKFEQFKDWFLQKRLKIYARLQKQDSDISALVEKQGLEITALREEVKVEREKRVQLEQRFSLLWAEFQKHVQQQQQQSALGNGTAGNNSEKPLDYANGVASNSSQNLAGIASPSSNSLSILAAITDFDSAYEAAYNKMGYFSLDRRSNNRNNIFGNDLEANNSSTTSTLVGWTGLYNAGNTCFMNATLQALLHCPRLTLLFRNKIVKSAVNINNSEGTNGVMSGCFAALVDLALSGTFKALKPRFFIQMFGARVNPQFADGHQHDALEFQMFLLNALSEDIDTVSAQDRCPIAQDYSGQHNVRECAEDYIQRANRFSFSEIKRIFNLTTVCTLQCEGCAQTFSVFFEQNFHISVELPESKVSSGRNGGKPSKRNKNNSKSYSSNNDNENNNYGSSYYSEYQSNYGYGSTNYRYNQEVELSDCLEGYFSPVPMDCCKCKQSGKASSTVRVWRCPNVLVVHLKRFQQTGAGQRFTKIQHFVRFPVENFDLGPYMHPEAPKGNGSTEYELFAVTNHSGTLAGGHYTAYAKNIHGQQEWLEFNDSICSPIHKDKIVTKDALVLYYSLRK